MFKPGRDGTMPPRVDFEVMEEQRLIHSNQAPGAVQKRLALAVVLGILIVYVMIVVGPRIKLGRIEAFVPAYLTAIFILDLITAILLYVQFSILRSRANLLIASGYLFAALMLIPYMLVFPGMFVPGNMVGGMQSTSWTYFIQHAGFPLFVIGYTLSKDADPSNQIWQMSARTAITRSVALTVLVVTIAAYICIAGAELLPRVTIDSTHLSPLWPYVGASVALISVAALVLLWIRRRTALDLWLMVVLFLLFMDKLLSYYPDPGRFSLGWYTVRVFVFISSSLVLIVMLYEIGTIYSRLLNALRAKRREREARLITGDAVAATIAHEVKQPLTAMITTADAGYRFLDRSTPNLDKAKEAFHRIATDGHRAGAVVDSIRANFRHEEMTKTSLDINELIRDALALEHGDLLKHHISVKAEPSKQLPAVLGNRVQLQQVLLNLMTNAIDAMASKEEPRVLFVKSESHEIDGVMISIADNGTGIGSEDIDRIFNPLFTTKPEGMGMGLSICRSIIEAHAGQLWVASNLPQGAMFQFTLRAKSTVPAAA